jgi:hypothetical protein
MAKQMLNIPSFGGGLNTALDPRDIKPSELSASSNVVFDTNGIIKPAGRCDDALGSILKFPNNDIYTEDLRGGMNLYYFESNFRRGEFADDSTKSTTWASDSEYKLSEIFSHKLYDDEDDGPLEATTRSNHWYLFATDSDAIGVPGVHAYTSYIQGQTNEWHENVISPYDYDGIGRQLHAVFHYNNNAVRVNNSFETYANRCKWFGFIRQRNFFVSSADTTDYHFNGWYELDNDIKKPTDLEFITDGSLVGTSLTEGAGFEIKVFAMQDTGSMDFSEDLDSSDDLKYDFLATFIYDDIQESLPFEITGEELFSDNGTGSSTAATAITAADDALNIQVVAKTGYNPRITGGRIYYRKSNSNDDYVLLCDIDFEKGLRASLDDSYATSGEWTVVSGSGTNVFMKSNAVILTRKNLDTYSSLTEWGLNEKRISIGCTGNSDGTGNYPASGSHGYGETYEASTITNGRCFIANTRLYKTEGTNARPDANHNEYSMEPNRIYYSGVCSSNGVDFQPAYDCFPRRNFIDIESENASGFTALFGFADRLFAFKRDILYIINVAGKVPQEEWFVESEHEGLGIELSSQFSQFDEGAVWANKTGVYVYTGNDIRTSTSEDISFGVDIKNIWNEKLASTANMLPRPLVGYSRYDKSIVVHTDYKRSSANTFVYNFKTDTWAKCNRITKTADAESIRMISNFIIGHNERLQFAKEMDGTTSSPTSLIVNHNFPSNDSISDGDHSYDNGDGTIDGWPTSGSNSDDILLSKFGSHATHNTLMLTYNDNSGSIPSIRKHVHYGPIALTYHNLINLSGFIYTNVESSQERIVDMSFVSSTSDSLEINKQVISTGSHGVGGYEHFSYSVGEFSEATGDYFFRIGTEWGPHPLDNIGNYVLIDLGGVESPGLTKVDTGSAEPFIKFFGIDVNSNILDTYSDIDFNSGSQSIVTKDFDFGQPGLKKRIYNVFCTYSTDNSHSAPVSYALDGSNAFVSMTGNFDNTSKKWKAGRFYSSSPLTCQSIKFMVQNKTDDKAFKLNDMSIEHRITSRKIA